MKTINLLTTVILFFVASLSFAQKGLNFSVKGMPQASIMMSKTDFDNPDHESNVYYGSAFGVGIGYNFTNKLGVSMDFLFSSEGNKYAYDTVLNTKFEYIEQYKYFKIPLQIVFSGETSNTVCFRGKFGPYMGIFRKGDVETWDGEGVTIYDENLIPRSNSDIIEDEYQSFVFGLALNLGLAINITDQIAIDTGFRSDFGLTDARDRRLLPHDPESDHSSNPLTVAWEFGVRYTLSD